MKTENEFLDGVWDKIHITESEEYEKQLAWKRHKNIFIKNISMVLLVILLTCLYLLVYDYIDYINIFSISGLAMFAAFMVQQFIDKAPLENKKGLFT